MIEYDQGNMLQNPNHDCYVNSINCVGVMGAGIALEFKNYSPEMFEHYQQICSNHLIAPGDSWIYQDFNNKWLVGLAIKYHFRHRARTSWAKMAIRNFVNQIKTGKLKVKNVALPRFGANNGGRGAPFTHATDNWPANSEEGWKLIEPFLLAELEKLPNVKFTIYDFQPCTFDKAS